MTPCPTTVQLEALRAEQLPGPQRGLIEGHVEGCPSCRDFLAQRGEGRTSVFCGPPMPSDEPDPAPAGTVTPTHTPAPPDDQPLPQVPGYELVGEIGRGGMGIVYRAMHQGLRRVVALKVIRAGEYAHEDERRRFRVEAEAAARINHPHVVQVYDVGEHSGLCYLAMEYVEGGSLGAALHGQPIDAPAAAALLERVSRAVGAAHASGVVHRDLKPANILLARSGGRTLADREPKVADFGLARRLDVPGQTSAGVVMGTPSYMAPEQAQGQANEAGPPADIYSLGAVLYTLLTGRPPFVGTSKFDTLVQVVNAEPVAPSRLRPGLPRDLETICLKCLEKEPAKRYPSADALADDLGRFLRHEPIRARPVGPWGRLTRWCRRNPADALLSGAVALALLLGAIAASAFAVRAEISAAEARDNEKLALREKATADDATRAAERELTRAEMARYALLLRLAQSEWEQGNMEAAARLLEECPERFRHWEYRHLRHLVQSGLNWLKSDADGPRIVKDAGSLYGVTFRPDGRQLATGDKDGVVRLWDSDTLKEVRRFKANPTAWTRQLAYSPDGNFLAVTGASEVRLWDLLQDKEVRTLPGSVAVAYSPDGQLLLTGDDRNVVAWEARTGKERWKVPFPEDVAVLQLAFSPDGKLFAAGKFSVRVWETASRREIHRHSVKSGVGITGLAFSHDNSRLLVSSLSAVAELCDLTGGQPARLLSGHENTIWGVGFHPRKNLAATGGPRSVRLWALGSSRPARLLSGPKAHYQAVAISPDGLRLAAVGSDGHLVLWQTQTPSPCEPLGDSDTLADLAFHPDQQLLYLADNGTKQVRIWDLGSSKQVGQLAGCASGLTSVCRTPDGSRVVAGLADGSLFSWEADSGRPLGTVAGKGTPAALVAASTKGRLLSRTSEGRGGHGHAGRADLLDGKDGTERLAVTGEPRGYFPPCTALSEDGSRWAVAVRTSVRVFDPATKEERFTLRGAAAQVYALAFSADGRWLAAGCQDGLVVLWDLSEAREPQVLKGHAGAVLGVSFSRDGRRLLSCAWDRTARIWDVEQGMELLALHGTGQAIFAAHFSPDGRRVACLSAPIPSGGGSRWGRAWLWEAIP